MMLELWKGFTTHQACPVLSGVPVGGGSFVPMVPGAIRHKCLNTDLDLVQEPLSVKYNVDHFIMKVRHKG